MTSKKQDEVHHIKLSDGSTMKISEEAGVYVAATYAASSGYRSKDDSSLHSGHSSSFLHRNFNESRFRENYFKNSDVSSSQKHFTDVEDDVSSNSNDDDFMAQSDHEHFHKKAKRQNLIDMFLHGAETNVFIVTHLYEECKAPNYENGDDLDEKETKEILLEDIMDFDFKKRLDKHQKKILQQNQKKFELELSKIRKMNPFETYIAICKANCGPILLFTTKAFSNGGYLFSTMALGVAVYMVIQNVKKLVQLSKHFKCFSYPLIVKNSIGRRGQIVLEMMITIAHFCFSVTCISFLTSSLRDIFSLWMYDISRNELLAQSQVRDFKIGDIRQVWTYGFLAIILLSCLAYVRNIAVFSFTFLIANSLILSSVVIISSYSITKLIEDGVAEGVVPFNTEHMFSTVGFSVYLFEGIGVLMPIMQASEKPEIFDKLALYAYLTVTSIYCFIGAISYIAFGQMDKQMITQILPTDDVLVQIMTIGFCVVVMFGYPLQIYPCNLIIESKLIDPHFKDKSPRFKYWLKNLSKTMVCIFAAVLGINFINYLDKVVSLVGAFCGTPLCLIIPNVCHLMALADTKEAKLKDLLTIMFSMVLMGLCIYQTIKAL